MHKKFLDVVVHYSGDRGAFSAIWNRVAPRDGRTSLARQWEVLGDALFKRAAETDADSPWVALEAILTGKHESAPVEFKDWIDPLKQHLHEVVHSQWEDLHLQRVPDLIDLTLYRTDGTRAGSVQQGDLSDGQRNTAALALLLAQGDGPLVIDQPEDELDSSFIYWDLVPMLRRIKDHRQLIFATHNANLPVNGDAELLYALETRGGRGERLAEGGLDRSSVNVAVLDVMEGSAEAFQKRREKYHF